MYLLERTSFKPAQSQACVGLDQGVCSCWTISVAQSRLGQSMQLWHQLNIYILPRFI